MIRKYKDEDLDIIMKIWQEENINAHRFIPGEYWKNNYKYVKELIPNAEIWVYTIDDNIVGFIGLNENYIEGIFVDHNYHKKGIGTELLRKVMKKNRELSLRVYEKNKVAISFYNKNLFKIIEKDVDESTGEYEYLMNWNLDNIK